MTLSLFDLSKEEKDSSSPSEAFLSRTSSFRTFILKDLFKNLKNQVILFCMYQQTLMKKAKTNLITVNTPVTHLV